MPTHTTPPPHADQTDQTAEPARRAPRFDERGIALQTVIIMVVLLAIAGSVAAVLFSRAQDATDELESASIVASPYAARSNDACNRVGGTWTAGAATGLDLAELRSVNKSLPNAATMVGFLNGQPVATGAGLSWCKPS